MPSDEMKRNLTRQDAKLLLAFLRHMDEIEDMSDEELALALVRDIWSDMKTHTREAILIDEAAQRLAPGLSANFEELNDERHADF